MPTLTPLDTLRSWRECTRCGLHALRRSVVLGRGRLAPADLLFVGEAPGKTEDLRGEAFFGPSGRILDAGLRDAQQLLSLPMAPTYYITNVLGCRPTDTRGGPNREPTSSESWACWPRLQLTAAIVRPKTIVLLGNVAQKFCCKVWPMAYQLVHPAYILRKGGQASPVYRDFVQELVDVLEHAAGAAKQEEL